MSDFIPSVSVIINTLGRADLLSDALRGLTSLDWPKLEVVVVNGPSDDHTHDVIQQWADRIKIGFCPEANLAKSRNIGLSLSSGEIVAFIDDDAVPHPSWLKALVEPYRDERVGAVGGHTIGRMGSVYQARTTLCDRFGDPYFVSSHVDLRVFSEPGSWIYPAMLGTNSSMRRTAIEAIGGFDEVFSYYLDETDICLRLIDAGWRIEHAPEALIWHQFASSALRSSNMTRRSVHAIIRSHCYFINRHGTKPWSPQIAKEAADRLATLRQQWLGGNLGSLKDGVIDTRHRAKLDREVDAALQEGFHLAQLRATNVHGDWQPAECSDFQAFHRETSPTFAIAFVCRYFDREAESGIPRWTKLLANGLADRGHQVHIITEATDPETRIRFTNGIWTHQIQSNAADFGWIAERYGMPADQAQWAASVYQHVAALRSFGLDILSFPIWDLEGVGCLDNQDLTICMSLHTSYGLSTKFRSDWAARPLLRDAIANRMIKAENLVLAETPHLLANSQSIVVELENQSNVQLHARARLAVHGVDLPGQASHSDISETRSVLFVGRFEKRKGIDIALAAVASALENDVPLQAIFVGGESLGDVIDAALQQRVDLLVEKKKLEFRGIVAREELETLYQAADIALLPSRYESFGLVAAEALATGSVVLGLNVGGIAEVVTSNHDGILVIPDEKASDALAKALTDLVADPIRLRQMQANARQSASDRFSIDRMINEAEDAFLGFLARDRSASN